MEGKLWEINVKQIKIAQIITHPNYRLDKVHFNGQTPALLHHDKVFKSESFKGAMENDIAILRLAEKVDLSKYAPACLPQKSDRTEKTYDGKTAIAVGIKLLKIILISTVS